MTRIGPRGRPIPRRYTVRHRFAAAPVDGVLSAAVLLLGSLLGWCLIGLAIRGIL